MTVGDVAGVSLRDILPESMQEPLEPEAGEDELDMNSAHNPLNSNESSDYIFPCAIIRPGALRILHNMTSEVDESLEFYAVWLGDFKQLVNLLHDDHLRNRLIGTCIVGRHEWMKPLVRKLAEPTLWRWNAVVQILNNLVKCKGVLQAVWSAELFSHDQESGGQGGEAAQASGSQLDIPALTRIIGCEKFWLYCSMLLQLHAMSDELCAWFESCPCHPVDFFQRPQPGPEQGQQADYEDEHVCLFQQVRAACEAAAVPSEDFRGCPLAGQRSTDLACGRCFDVLQEVSQRGLADLLRYTHIGGDHEDWQTAYSDFNRGYAQYTSYLTQKLQCWQELPWKFAALNHIDPAQVRLQAQVLVDKLDSSPQQRDLRHRVTWLFLCKDSAGNEALLLRQLRALASGQSLLADPDMLELRRFAQDLRFIPTVERVQEADHSIVKRTVYLRKVSGPYVSTAIRTAEMQNKFRTPSDYHELLQRWPKVLDADGSGPAAGSLAPSSIPTSH